MGLPRVTAGGFNTGVGGLGTDELANMLLQGTFGHKEDEEDDDDGGGALVSASVGWSLKVISISIHGHHALPQ